MTFEVGQVCELRRRDEDGDFWFRIRIVSVSDTSAWVRLADRIGNSFPVPLESLRPLDRPERPLRGTLTGKR